MDDTQISIADKDDNNNVTSKEPMESVTEETDESVTEEITTEDVSTEEPEKQETTTEGEPEKGPTEEQPTEEPPVVEPPVKEPSTGSVTTEKVPTDGALTENNVYSFFQTPHAWEQGRAWGGEWGTYEFAGKSFGNFGCGMCCMANIYDTLSPYEVSPWDMFEYAQAVSSYSPSSAGAAISWNQMQDTLRTCGISCELYCKPWTYEEFKQQVMSSETVLVLVSSANDNTYWDTTKGHYVTIWLYDESTDTVFLADSGRNARNRQRIPLTYVYNALKTASNYQYMTVSGYEEANNVWKANGITENWIRP